MASDSCPPCCSGLLFSVYLNCEDRATDQNFAEEYRRSQQFPLHRSTTRNSGECCTVACKSGFTPSPHHDWSNPASKPTNHKSITTYKILAVPAVTLCITYFVNHSISCYSANVAAEEIAQKYPALKPRFCSRIHSAMSFMTSMFLLCSFISLPRCENDAEAGWQMRIQ